jgi:hypothetical protein
LKLIFATLFVGHSRLAAVVEDADGKQRRIALTWMATGPESLLPPVQWDSSIIAEAEHRQSEELRPSLSRWFGS